MLRSIFVGIGNARASTHSWLLPRQPHTPAYTIPQKISPIKHFFFPLTAFSNMHALIPIVLGFCISIAILCLLSLCIAYFYFDKKHTSLSPLPRHLQDQITQTSSWSMPSLTSSEDSLASAIRPVSCGPDPDLKPVRRWFFPCYADDGIFLTDEQLEDRMRHTGMADDMPPTQSLSDLFFPPSNPTESDHYDHELIEID